MIDRDRDADKLALVGAFGVLPFAFSVLGCWMWPLFNSAGSSLHQEYKLNEILIGFVGGGAIGFVLGAILLWFRSKTEQPEEDVHH
jgi:hypothetical protein